MRANSQDAVSEFRPYFDNAPVYGHGPSLEDFTRETPLTVGIAAAGHRPLRRHARLLRRLPAPAVPHGPRRTAAEDRARAARHPRRRGRAGAAQGAREEPPGRGAGCPDPRGARGGEVRRPGARARRSPNANRGDNLTGGSPYRDTPVVEAEPGSAFGAAATRKEAEMTTASHRRHLGRAVATRRRPGCWPTGWPPPRYASLARARASRPRSTCSSCATTRTTSRTTC